MIDLYYWTTPNGHKVTIFLEETGLPYTLRPVNIGKGEQFDPAFLAIAPNNRIPAIVDHVPPDGDGPLSMMESGAILLYLAGKTGRFYPNDLRGRAEVVQWLFWQMAGLGPMAGQTHHFLHYAPEPFPYAIDRYVRETGRLYGVLNKRLADREFVAGGVLDRRHGLLPLGAARAATAGPRRFPAPETLARGDRRAARGAARVCAGEGGQSTAEAACERGGTEDPLRPGPGHRAIAGRGKAAAGSLCVGAQGLEILTYVRVRSGFSPLRASHLDLLATLIDSLLGATGSRARPQPRAGRGPLGRTPARLTCAGRS